MADPALGPVRMCVGCRQRSGTDDLLRVVAAPVESGEGASWTLVVDHRRRMGGRGAWVHPHVACVTLGERRRAFQRALRLPGIVGVESVLAALGPAESQNQR